MFSLILAMDDKNGIAKDGKIPWHCSEDLKLFRKLTTPGIVIMGRKTWETLPKRKLPGRTVIVLSRNALDNIPDNVIHATSIADCLRIIHIKEDLKVWVAGGANIALQFLKGGYIVDAYISRMKGDYSCDQTLDLIPNTTSTRKYTGWELEYMTLVPTQASIARRGS